MELIAGILLLIPITVWAGALLTLGLMSGAIMGHLTKIGIEHNNDGGLLFGAAVVTLICGIVVLFSSKKNIPFIGDKL